MKIFLIFLFMSMLNSNAIADGWQGYTTVKGYVFEGANDASRMYVNMAINSNPSPSDCTNGVTGWKRVYANTEKGKYIASAILTAYATKQRIQLSLSGCDDWGRNIVQGVMIHD